MSRFEVGDTVVNAGRSFEVIEIFDVDSWTTLEDGTVVERPIPQMRVKGDVGTWVVPLNSPVWHPGKTRKRKKKKKPTLFDPPG